MSAGSQLTNTGTISGGQPGYNNYYHSGRYGGVARYGGVGVIIDGGTLVNAGTIQGVAYDAVDFGSGSGTLVVESGAKFSGHIGGFAVGDTIDVRNLAPTAVLADFHVTGTTATDGSIQFAGGASGETLATTASQNEGTLALSGDFSGETFVLTADGNGGTDVTETACYVRGTRIATTRGEVAIEELTVGDRVLTATGEHRPVRWLGSRSIDCDSYADPKLRVGDAVVTASGESRPVRWIGRRTVDCNRYPNPTVVWPIRIQAGAFAENQPSRDLCVSPGHSMLIGGVLIQAEKLVNGATIVQVPRQRVEYWHVELDNHDILIAEGLPTESYLDTGNRSAFVNGGASMEAYPDFKPKHWRETCVPLILEGPEVRSARELLLARAEVLGYARTDDPDLHLLADDQRLDPVRLGDNRVAFILPAGHSAIELRCRNFTPAQINPESDDHRSLGVCVSRLQLDGAEVALEDDASFASGWHALERNHDGSQWRWSQDRMPLPAGTRLLVLDFCYEGPHYWCKPPSSVVALFG
jgi:hypothetical protein